MSFRPRISILTALLLMAMLGMAIVIVQQWRLIKPMRDELTSLRNETGRLAIDDPTKFHAIEVRTDGECVWKWRVWVPEGREYQINIATENIPKDAFPSNNGMIVLSKPGESWIEYRITKDPDGKSWMDQLSTSNGSVGSRPQPWVTWGRKMSTDGGVGHKTQSFEPGQKILLERHRVSQKATSSNQIEDPSAGFMIWLEPTK
jgi:hypothetical protein